MKTPHTLALAGLFILASHVSADTFYVDDDAPPGGNGRSWSQPFRFLSDALIAAESEGGSNTIRVAGGTYLPDRSNANPSGTGNRAATFDVPGATTIRGGYAGVGANNPNERNIEKYQTILSGDLTGDDSADGSTNDNAWHVLSIDGTTAEVELDGLTVTHGVADMESDSRGGGIWIHEANVTLLKCRIERNVAIGNDSPRGGGIYAVRSELNIYDSLLSRNRASDITEISEGAHKTNGGAIAASNSIVQLVRCRFDNNYVSSFIDYPETSDGSQRGGALWIASTSTLTAVDCEFNLNISSSQAADSYGGGFYVTSTNAIFERCRFLGCYVNALSTDPGYDGPGTAWGGAGAIVDSHVILRSCYFFGCRVLAGQEEEGGTLWKSGGTLLMENCAIAGQTYVGAVENDDDSIFRNCTFAGLSGPGVRLFPSCIMTNCVLINNGVFYLRFFDQGGAYNYNCIAGMDPEDDTGVGNIYGDPMLQDDLTLSLYSPCLDAGDNSAVPADLDVDLNGFLRIRDVVNYGAITGAIVDMGAYEAFADCNTNSLPDDEDVLPRFINVNSGDLSPFGFDAPKEISLNAPIARSDVTIQIEASGDLNGTGEFISVALNSNSLGNIFVTGAADCATPPNKQPIILSADAFNAAIVDNMATISLQPSSSVSSGACDDANFIRVNVSYLSYVDTDENSDGVPDQCAIMGDLNGDSVVDITDLFNMLAAFGPCGAPCPPTCIGDITGPTGTADCKVDVNDLFALLSNWSG